MRSTATAWDAYYTPEHMRTILRRAAASGMGMSRLLSVLFFFSTCFQVEGVHPLQGGVFRLKYRRDRRSTLPIEPVWSFYPKYLWEIASKHARIARHWFWLDRVRKHVKREQRVSPYTDLALTAVTDDETESFDLFTHNEAARGEVVRTRKIAALTHNHPAPPTAQHA